MTRKNSLLGKICGICGCFLNDNNRGKRSPYFCQPCDEARIKQITKNLEEIAADMGIKVPWEVE